MEQAKRFQPPVCKRTLSMFLEMIVNWFDSISLISAYLALLVVCLDNFFEDLSGECDIFGF